jgi:hypothetical protein
MQLENDASGQWIAGSGEQSDLIDAITGDLIGTTSNDGSDFGSILNHARTTGPGPEWSIQDHCLHANVLLFQPPPFRLL